MQLSIRPSGQLLGRRPRVPPGSLTHDKLGNVPDLNDEGVSASHPKVEYIAGTGGSVNV